MLAAAKILSLSALKALPAALICISFSLLFILKLLKALRGGNDFFSNFLSFYAYLVENFLCFPTVYNIPGLIFNGFQNIWPDN